MSQTSEMVIMEYSLEELRCSLCTGYLSCAPIQVLPDGSSICGRCSVTGEEQTYRMLKLEAILSNTLFPCRYKKNGCEERAVFSRTDEHEVTCDYRTVACACLADEGCAWEGPALQIMDHTTKHHPNYVVENAEFKIQVDQDSQGRLIVPVNNVVFGLAFKYTANSGILHYDVKYFTQNVQEACYKIKLINDADGDYCSNLKGGACLPFNVYDMQKIGLVLNNFFQILNTPNLIKIAVDISVTISNGTLTLDNDLLQTIRCNKCQGYLIPPLFDDKLGVVCSNCSKILPNSKPLDDNELEERVAKASFPCYWIGCNFIGNAVDFQQHADTCSFRVYECIDTTCKETFKQDQAIMHLEGHDYEHFLERFVYKFTFEKEAASKSIITFKNNGIISVQYKTCYVATAGEYRHEMTLGAFGTDLNKIVVNVQFAHEHCKLKSKLFKLSITRTAPVWYFNMSDLPACFKQNEELTVMLEVGNTE